MQWSAVINLLSFLILCELPSAWMQDIIDLDKSREELEFSRIAMPRSGRRLERASCLRGRHRCSMPCYLPSCRPCPPCPIQPDTYPGVQIVNFPAPNSGGFVLEGELSQLNNEDMPLPNGRLSAPLSPIAQLSLNVRPVYAPLNIEQTADDSISQLLLNL